MNVLVSDTSVLIDLDRGQFLEATFSASIQLAVPDLLYDQELLKHKGPYWISLGLRILELDDQGVSDAVKYTRQVSAISTPDSFALVLAKTSGLILLTGDRQLRKLAEREQVECHGVLWILDILEQQQTIPKKDLHKGLQKIANHPRCRLPKSEIACRIKRWKGEG